MMSNDSVLQAACYGCGVMAQYGGEEYITACTGLLPGNSEFFCEKLGLSRKLDFAFSEGRFGIGREGRVVVVDFKV